MNKKLLTWMLALLLLVPTAFSLGITPGRTTIDFTPNADREFNFKVINNEYRDLSVMLLVQGELEDTITLHQEIITFTSEEYSKSFTFDINLPAKLETPGIHEASIIAVELPEDYEGQTSVRATAAVAMQLRVKVPYPGKYLEAKLDIETKDNKTLFFVSASNLGTDNIQRAKATIDIYDPENKKVATVETTERSIRSKQRVDLVGSAALTKGAYKAVMNLTYDEHSLIQEKEFKIGDLWIDVREIFVRNFRLGEIAKFNILVESVWNELIQDVYAQLIMKTKDDDIVADIKSPSFDIKPNERTTTFAYWDTEDIGEGVYYGKVILHYEGKTTEKALRTYVSLDGIEVIDLTAAAVQLEPGRGLDKEAILTLSIIIIILTNIGWFIYFKRKQARK